MFDLTVVRTKLLASAPSLDQVILPTGDGSLGVNTASLLTSLVGAQISNRVYPLILPDRPTYPSATYQLVGSVPIPSAGYPYLREDGYILRIQSTDYSQVRSTAETVRAALLAYTQSGGAGTITIQDQADKHNPDTGLFETAIALSVTHLALAAQDIPAAFVFLRSHDAVPTNRYGTVFADEESRLSVLYVARIPANGVSALASVSAEIVTAVMAVTATGWGKPKYYGGSEEGIHNTLVLWREDFGIPRTREF